MLFLNNLVESLKTGFGEQFKINKKKIRSFFGFYLQIDLFILQLINKIHHKISLV